MKIKKSDLLSMIQEQNDVIDKLIRQVNCHHEDIIRIEGIVEPEPQLKQLDQSVFIGEDERLSCAAIESDGRAYLFEPKAEFKSKSMGWDGFGLYKLIGEGYPSYDWQNSLIKRDTAKGLTGSDLARAMLARGDKCVLIRMGVRDDKQARDIGRFAIATSIDEAGRFNVMSDQQPISKVDFAVPINNQGEPLTASEVGL